MPSLTITYQNGTFTVTPSTLDITLGQTIDVYYPSDGMTLCFDNPFMGSKTWTIPLHPTDPNPYPISVPSTAPTGTFTYDPHIQGTTCSGNPIAIGSHKIVVGSGHGLGGEHHHHDEEK